MKQEPWVWRGAGALVVGGAVAACASLTGLDSYSTSCSGEACDASTPPSTGDDATTIVPTEAAQTQPPEDQESPPEEAGPVGEDGESPDDATADVNSTTLDSGSDADAAASLDAGANAEAGGGHDSGTTSSDGGCESTDTVQHCGSCGAACSTSTGTPSCNGISCSYQCSSGKVDCNAPMAPDTDGCECAGTACCGTSCQTSHTSGLTAPNAYYNCGTTGNSTLVEATAACLGVGGGGCTAQNAMCGAVFGVGGTATNAVCGTVSNTCYCWVYSGSNAGTVAAAIGACTMSCLSGSDWN